MTWKNWRSHHPVVTVNILALLALLITFGSTSFAASSVQQPIQGENSQNINTPSEDIQVNQGENISAINASNEDVLVSLDTTKQSSPSNNIVEGFYALGGTDQGLEVKGKQFRYYDELGVKDWQAISGLKYVRNGVVFDGKLYWCLSTLAPRNIPAACSAKGWNQEILPFVGTKRFNFLGGTGTGQSITIQEDGTTIIKSHGLYSSSVRYRGNFSNPIIFEDGFGLLLKDNKIYSLSPNGQIGKGCKGDGKLCESELY